MAEYLLDTYTVSALMHRDARVLARLERVSRTVVSVPQVVLAEIAYGVERFPEGRKKESLRDALELLRTELPRAEWTDAVTDDSAASKRP